MIDYDANVIQNHADALYRQARVMMLRSAFIAGVGVLIVVYILAAASGTKARTGFGEFLMLFLLGALVGGAWGQGRGAALRLQAQLALCQKQIEENTRPARLPAERSAGVA